jgi:hypothetical protein
MSTYFIMFKKALDACTNFQGKGYPNIQCLSKEFGLKGTVVPPRR